MSLRWRHEGWRKLYIREEGTFAQLPLYTRALAGELLKICDSAGRIDCMGKAPWAAVAWRLGATRGDRRLLKRDLDALIADGYLRRDADTGDLVIRNFLEAHPHLALAMEGIDRIPVEDVGAGAAVVELAGAGGGVTAMAPPCPIPGDEGAQIGLFSWSPPPTVADRATIAPPPGTDATTTVPRNLTQPVEIVAVVSEDQRRSEKSQRERAAPPPSRQEDEIGIRRTAQRLAERHEELRAGAADDLGVAHIALPLADLAGRLAMLLRQDWSEEALATAISSTSDEARRKRTLVYFNGADNLKPDALKRAIARAPARRVPVVRQATPPVAAAAAAQPQRAMAAGDLEATWRTLGLDEATIQSLRARTGG